jgi:hypothetical protein
VCFFLIAQLPVKIFAQRGSDLKCIATTKGVKGSTQGKAPKMPKWNELFLLTYVIRILISLIRQ